MTAHIPTPNPNLAEPDEPARSTRVRNATVALTSFAAESGLAERLDEMHPEDLECLVVDLLVNLLHLTDAHGLNAEQALWLAELHFYAEKDEPDR